MKSIFVTLFALISIAATAQNVVLLKGPDYCVFRWGQDTLDTSVLPEFFMLVYGDRDSVTAKSMARQCTYFLNRNETGVDALNDQLLKSLFVSLDDYACFARLREKRTRIIFQNGN